MSGESPLLMPETDYLLDRDKAAMGTTLTAYRGGDPLVDPPAFGYPESMQVEIERRLILEQDRTSKMNDQVFRNPQSGWGTIKKFMDGVFDRYKTQNESQLLKKPKNEQEILAQMEQMRPVQVDPNEVAEIRQLAVNLDQQMKAVDPRTSFWTDPRTKNYAEWINREAGVGTAGFMVSGEQEPSLGAVGRPAYAAWQGVEGIAAGPLALIHGAWDLGRKSISAMGGPDIGASYPTNYVQADDGSLVANGGKAPSIMDGIAMAWGYATDQNIQQFAAEAGRAQEWELANRAGLAGLTTSVSRLGGELIGIAPGFGAAAKLGQATTGTLTMRGLQMLGALRLGKGMQQSDRALKIIGAMSKGIGQAAGLAAYESVTQGRIEGYGAAYMHGLMMAPVLMTLGALGKKTEWFAQHRANMPGAAARAVAGGLEGAGFGAVETLAPEVLPNAWDFIRDPNQSTWETFAKNMLAFGLVKTIAGRTTGAPPEVMQVRRGIGRAQFAEKVARGEATPEEVAGAPVPNEQKLRELGEASIRGDVRRLREVEAELDVEEFGKGPAEQAVKEFVEGKEPGPIEEKIPPEELQRREERRIREMPDPLEDPRFSGLPESVQEEILEAPDAEMRKQIMAARAPERRVAEVPRETTAPPEELKQAASVPASPRESLEQRPGEPRTASGQRAGPQSLQAQPTTQIAPTPGTQPVRAMDIYTEMEGRPGTQGFRIPFTATRVGGQDPDAVRVSMRAGKIAGGSRAALGVFRVFENLVRTQEGRDLAVASHEWSHAMHRHTSGGGGRQFIAEAKRQVATALAGPDGPAIDFEMRETLRDYPGSAQMPKWLQWMETWAEWHARNLLGEVGLDRKLPAISAYMRGWLAAPAQARLRDQYQRLQGMLYRYNAQGALERVRQTEVSGAAAPTETELAHRPSRLRSLLGTINQALFDDRAQLKASQDKWLRASGRRPEDVSIMDDPARLADTLSMTANKVVEHFVTRGIRLPGRPMIPGLRTIMESVSGREADFRAFVIAMRNMELYRTGKEIQLPPQDYVEAVHQLSAQHPDFVDQLVNLKRWTDGLVDYVQGAGNISVEDAQRIKDAYAVYVPFFRAIEGPGQHGQGRGIAERGTGLARIKGSTFEVKDPFIALQQVARSMVTKAHQNQVMAALFKMAMGQEAGGLASIVPRTSVPTTHPLRRILDMIEAESQLPGAQQQELESVFQALRDNDALNPQTITLFTQKVIPTGEKNIIAFTPRLTDTEINQLVAQGAHRQTVQAANNSLQWLEVDTAVYESLMGIDKMPQLPERMQPMMQWMQAPRDLVRFFATGVAPGFVAANMVRDALSTPLFDRQGRFRPFGGFLKLIKGAIEYHRGGEMRELYEELGVKTSSFWTEGRQRELIGEQATLWQRAKAMADRVQNWFSHPENYIRMSEFSDTYQAAIRAGRSEQVARMEALEGGREITVNFARAGIWARVMNQLIPYFNAGMQGQRKLWGQLMGGTDVKGDTNRARIQRATVLNGLANITVPATLLWLLNKDEEWYQDLPDWRKTGYFNFEIGDEIISIPKPFEAGVLFGSLPEIMLDRTLGSNPAGIKQAMLSLAGPYFEGIGALIPAALKPILEVATNRNLFTNRPLTPEWISRAMPPEEQATFYTPETAKIISRAINGILTPTEIEAVLGGYTAGATTSGMKILDEIAGLKDHPGITANPLARFTKQQKHGQSSFVDQLYELSVRFDQREEALSPQEQNLKRRVDTAKKQISDLRKRYRAGSISQKEAERRSYELARPLVEQSKGPR